MEKVITFFTETLSGTTYIVVVIIAVILFFACIGYLAERSIMRKKKEEKYISVPPVKNTVGSTQIDTTIKPAQATPVTQTVSNNNNVTQNVQPSVVNQNASPIIQPAINQTAQQATVNNIPSSSMQQTQSPVVTPIPEIKPVNNTSLPPQ